jgi:hypothetical protein
MRFYHLSAAITVATIGAPCVRASVIFYPATDEVKVVSDGETSVYVEYGVGKIFLVWQDSLAANLSSGSDNSGHSNTWSLWDEDWGPKTKIVVEKIRKWRDLPTAQQRKYIQASDAAKWDKAMFATANSPRRYPVQDPARSVVNESRPSLNADGCPEGQGRVTKTSGGFFGIGGKKEDIGCMTPYQLETLRQGEQRSRPVYVPPQTRNCTSNIIGSQVFTRCY